MRIKITERKNLFGQVKEDLILTAKKEPELYSRTGYVYRIGFPHFIGGETKKELLKKVKDNFGGKVTEI